MIKADKPPITYVCSAKNGGLLCEYMIIFHTDLIKKRIEQLGFSDALFADYHPENSHSVVDLKFEA